MKRLLYIVAVAIVTLLSICNTLSYCDNFKFVVTSDTQGADNGVDSDTLGRIVQATIDEGAEFILTQLLHFGSEVTILKKFFLHIVSKSHKMPSNPAW